MQRLLAATHMYFRRIRQEHEESLVTLACLGVAPWNAPMGELTRTLWRKYRGWIEKMIGGAAAERKLDIDACKAAITYVHMGDGLWIGWLLDPHAYTPDEAEGILRDWLLDLFGEKPAAPSLAA